MMTGTPSTIHETRFRIYAAFVLGQALTLLVTLSPLVGLGWWSGFRGYFANDQLSYAAVAANVSAGNFAPVEPFTQTGVSFYPSLWYYVIGTVSRISHIPVFVVWTLLGVAIVGLAVGVVGWVALRVSGWWFAPALAAFGLFAGTLSMVLYGNWHAWLNYHAVLWGPFAMLFTLNGEVAGISLGTMAISLLIYSAAMTVPARRRLVLVVLSATVLGLLANVHTYAFFSCTLLAAIWLSLNGLRGRHAGAWAGCTLALTLAALAAGPTLAGSFGPLPTYVVVLLAFSPGLARLALRNPALAALAAGGFALASSPQLVRTVMGLAQGDEFLTYREASTDNLGVPFGPGVGSAAILIVVAAACAFALWKRRQFALTSLIAALAIGGAILATNDRWGFNQEPYRFWVEFYTLAALLLPIPASWALSHAPEAPRIRVIAFRSSIAVAVALAVVGAVDFAGFWKAARTYGVVAQDDGRIAAATQLLEGRSDIVMSSKCLDPRILKLRTKARVAFFNRGMAWPEDMKAFEIFQDPGRRAGEDPVALRAANVRYVLTDTSCADDWQFPSGQAVVPLKSLDYELDGQPQKLTLSWVDPA
ncbi:MAG: hypothetical protein WCI74_15685 [Actinomycetes bacterium]